MPVTALLGATVLSPHAVCSQIAVVNSGNPVDDLSIDKLRLFLGQTATFPSGEHARLATHAASAARFDRPALELQPEIVRSRWTAIVFRGESSAPPAVLASTDEVDPPDAIVSFPSPPSTPHATSRASTAAGRPIRAIRFDRNSAPWASSR